MIDFVVLSEYWDCLVLLMLCSNKVENHTSDVGNYLSVCVFVPTMNTTPVVLFGSVMYRHYKGVMIVFVVNRFNKTKTIRDLILVVKMLIR